MNCIVVDDELLALSHIVKIVKEAAPEAEVTGFQGAEEALLYLEQHIVEIAFLDVEMDGLNGIVLAKKCKDILPAINIIFVTGHTQYTLDALRIHASGYMMKPVRVNEIERELKNLRYPTVPTTSKRVRIQTFGNFQIFVDQKALPFRMAKCKESLAYLVDRKGAFVTTGELAAVLWEDRPYDKIVQNNTHRVVSDLLKTLKSAGVRDIIIKTRREMCLDIEKVECDYYQFLKGDACQINAFYGEYMSNYSWAEFTLPTLEK